MPKKTNSNSSSAFVQPFIIGLAAGLYPVIFYYSNNYSLINSIKHLAFFVVLFLILPSVFFVVLQKFINKKNLITWRDKVFTFLNITAFLVFIQLCLYTNLNWIFTSVILLVAGVIAWFLSKYLKKIIILKLLMGISKVFNISFLKWNAVLHRYPLNIEKK